MDKKPIPLNSYIRKVEKLKHKAESLASPAEKTLKENLYFRSLLEITRSISTHRDFGQLLELIVDSAINLTNAERGFLILVSPDGSLEFKVTRNISEQFIESDKFVISRTVVNDVLSRKESLFLSDIYKDKKLKIAQSFETLGLQMVMCAPLETRDRLLGIIYVDSRAKTETFGKLEEDLFEAFAAQASIALENTQLYELSVRDALTGLYNLAYLRRRMEDEINRALRYKIGSISFLMLDLDNFKAINEIYGHQFGNKVLIDVANVINGLARKCDVAARYGGDEFAILLPETALQGARDMAERLLKSLSELSFSIGQKTISIASSIGISNFPIEKITNTDSIVMEADHALFVAKRKGKNQIVIFGSKKDEKTSDVEFIGESKAIRQMKTNLAKIAVTDATVLIVGETGTGKELVTHLIHRGSMRAHKPLVVVNCGAMPNTILESELFGHEKGAFTGAYAQQKGKFELAHGGTIFLDEIGEASIQLQTKILRAIEQKEIDRIGGTSPVKVDVRVIAATNKDLPEEVNKGNFRKDLFYRLSVTTVHLPPLRERPEDIKVLAERHLEQMSRKYHRRFCGFTKNAMDAMLCHSWIGNVRELIHRIERAVIMADGEYLDVDDIGLIALKSESAETLRSMKEKTEREGIFQSLTRNNWHIDTASRELGINPRTLRDLIKKHKLVKPSN